MPFIVRIRNIKADIFLGILTAIMAILGGTVSALSLTDPIGRAIFVGSFLILGILSCATVIIQANNARQAEERLQVQLENLENASTKLLVVQEENGELQRKVMKLAQQNAELSTQQLHTVTGGDSFCYMGFNFQSSTPIPVFSHCGRYPLYDLGVRIVDIDRMTKKAERGEPPALSDSIEMKIGELQPGMGTFARGLSVPFPSQTCQRFNIFFSARNGMWNQLLRLRRIGDHWSVALRVIIHPKPGEPLPPDPLPALERIDPDFPRGSDGSISWD